METIERKNKGSEASTAAMSVSAPSFGRAVTLADIAEYVGVSKVAASVVLNNSRSQVRVSPATRERILDAAKQLKYQPNAVARSLRSSRTNIIGFHNSQNYLFNPIYPFYGTILRGLLEGCEDHKKNLLIHGTFCNLSEDDIFLELLNGQIDGLVLYARERTPLIDRLIESRLPVVTVADEIPGLPCVTVDDEQGGRILAHYIAEQGYENVVFRVLDEALPSSIERRLHGFMTEATALGLNARVFRAQDPSPIGEEAELILSPQRPQVIATFSDVTADNLVSFCLENGVRVPQDMAITGFDGFTSSERPSRRLTTVRAPWAEVARAAVSLLVARCNGEEVPMMTKLPVEMVVGDTA